MKWKYILLTGLLVCIAGVVLSMYLGKVSIPMFQPAGPIARAEMDVMIITLALCSIVVIPVFTLLFVFAWKYRAGSVAGEEHHSPDWDHDNTTAEIVWWLVPTAIIFVLSIIMWHSSHALDPYKKLESSKQSITIEVVALDWKWLFIYPQFNIATVNMLTIPEGVPIHFKLTADAPMNSFWVPSLGGQIMVMPGMTTQLSLLASRVGTFDGFSANLSGRGFSGMAFSVNGVSESDFQTWVETQRQSLNPLTFAAYKALARPSEYNPVAYYFPVEEDLFSNIVDSFMMPTHRAMDGMSHQMEVPFGMPETSSL